jgi:hypothetical protein
MAYDPSHGEWVQELLARDLEHLSIKRMFGADGV